MGKLMHCIVEGVWNHSESCITTLLKMKCYGSTYRGVIFDWSSLNLALLGATIAFLGAIIAFLTVYNVGKCVYFHNSGR